MSEPYCGICGTPVSPETDHVEIEAQHIHTDGRDTQDDYYLHVECW